MDPGHLPSDIAEPTSSQERLRTAFTDVAPLKEEAPIKGEYTIRIPTFEGPLDLLLHLIRREQVNIYDIPVSKICKSYLEQLELMQQFDVDVAGEFMVMAATLIQLKSQFLLPRDEVADEEEDPRIPLVQQLLEYQRFKDAADQLSDRPWMGRDVYGRPSGAISEMIPKEALENAPVEPIDTFQLLLCLKTALNRTNRKPIEVAAASASLQDTLAMMQSALVENDTVSFAQLLPKAPQKSRIIMTFLTMLELAKMRMIEILQTSTFGLIQIRRVKEVKDLDLSFLEQY